MPSDPHDPRDPRDPRGSRVASRLHPAGRGAPLRGMGAGLPENQRLAGVASPEEAARLAAMGPEEARVAAEARAKAEEQREELIDNLLLGMSEGLMDRIDEATLRSYHTTDLARMHGELLKEREKMLDAELYGDPNESPDVDGSSDMLGGLRAGFGPEHHLYEPLMDTERRKRIEKDLPELDFESLLFNNYLDQAVPIRPNFEVTFRTIKTGQTKWLEEFVAELPRTSQQHIAHQVGLLQLAVALREVNGRAVFAHDISQSEDKEAFFKFLKANLAKLDEWPDVLTNDLMVQHTWFMGRVRKFFIGENLAKTVGN